MKGLLCQDLNVMDHYQIIRHKMSYIFSIFECSENGHLMNT
jgi:hypothetical protein